MSADYDRDDESLYDPSTDPFQNSVLGDPFAAPPAGDDASALTDADLLGDDSENAFAGDAFTPGGFDAYGNGGGGFGPGGGKRRPRLPDWAKLALIALAVLLAVLVLAQAFQPAPYTISLETDQGDILITVKDQPDGTYSVALEHALNNLDASQFYTAGFMMAPQGQTLNAVGDPFFIMDAASYTAKATFIIAQPGTYVVSFYSYTTTDALPSLTSSHVFTLGNGSATALPPNVTALIVTPSPSPSPTPRPLPTATPTPRVTLPSATATPIPAPKKLRPDSDVFDLYDVNTRYYYNQLTDTQKVIFSEMYDCVANALKETKITPCSREDYDYARTALMYDCPELFLMDYEDGSTFSRSSGDQVTAFGADDSFYRLSASASRAQLEKIMATIRSFTSLPGFGSSDYSKELAITNYIVEHTYYLKDVPNCAYADSVYIYGFAKCTGYSHALNLALRYYGIPCAVVIGRTYDNGVISPTSHMWSLVKIDGTWYHCDATWNDNENLGAIAYAYFNLNDRLMLAARRLEMYSDDYTKRYQLLFAPVPDCTSLTATYGKQEKYFIPSGSNLADTVARNLASSYRAGDNATYFLFESAADMNTAYIQIMDGSILKRASDILNTWPQVLVQQMPDVNAIIIIRK